MRRYKRRYKVERSISWLHNYRRLITRWAQCVALEARYWFSALALKGSHRNAGIAHWHIYGWNLVVVRRNLLSG
jgi:hypothetical protein